LDFTLGKCAIDASELAYIYSERAKWIKKKPDEIEYWMKFLAAAKRRKPLLSVRADDGRDQ
jgi:hypothetical protein